MSAQPDHQLDQFLSCIHCGMCTSSCPTYVELGSEADSPRGRIRLMRSVAEGTMQYTPDVIHHLEMCLDCQACVTACPSGVEYGQLIEDAREEIEENKLRPWRDRMAIKVLRDWLFPYPRRMKIALFPLRIVAMWPALLSRLRQLPALGKLVQLVPEHWLRGQQPDASEKNLIQQMKTGFVPAIGTRQGRVGLLTGCVGSLLFSDVNIATVYVLIRNGYDVVIPTNQGCCGSLHVHTGARKTASAFAQHMLTSFAQAVQPHDDTFSSYDAIIVNAAGCGSAMKQYGQLLPNDARAQYFAGKVQDVSEFLAQCDLAPMGTLTRRVTYHDACHLYHGQGVSVEPRALLRKIPGLNLVPLEESSMCCGSAGIYNIMQQSMGEQLGDRKIAHIRNTGASVVATGNSGCTMQIVSGAEKYGIDVEVMHPVQLMYEAYKALDEEQNRQAS